MAEVGLLPLSRLMNIRELRLSFFEKVSSSRAHLSLPLIA